MGTKLYQMTDVVDNEVILDNVYSQEITNYFKGAFTNVTRYATLGTLYRKRYRFKTVAEGVGPNRKKRDMSNYQSREEQRMGNIETLGSIYNKSLSFKIGDRVVIKISVKDEEGKSYVTKRIPATVIERYPYHLVVERKSGVQESFTYKDIVLFGVLEIKQGRPKKN